MQHGVVHYCVPNMTANVPRTASRVLTNHALPYVKALARKGLKEALRQDPALAGGVYTFEGRVANEDLGKHFGIPSTPIEDLLS
jgi:alanine dehydrogenase